jgi:ubiquinone/menaquinone biosynthesis C-methylase UbiE
MNEKNKHVCPVENAKSLDNIFRKLVQNPKKILKDYVKEGMTVLDVGCGPGFFSVEMADMVGESGKVIAADLQQGMLEKVEKKIKGSYIENRIELHKCEKDRIGITTKVDHILAIYMDKFLAEMYSILKPGGSFFIMEPPFHVSKKAFEETVNRACAIGFKEIKRPGMILNKAVVLGK